MKNGFSKQFVWAQLPPVGKLISSPAQKGTQCVCVPKQREWNCSCILVKLTISPKHHRKKTLLQHCHWTHVWEFKLHWSLWTALWIQMVTENMKLLFDTLEINSMGSFGSWVKLKFISQYCHLICMPALCWKHLSLYPPVIWKLQPSIWFQYVFNWEAVIKIVKWNLSTSAFIHKLRAYKWRIANNHLC